MTTEQVSSVRVLCTGPGRETCHKAAEQAGDEPITILTHLTPSLHDSPCRQSLGYGHPVSVLQIATDREPAGNP